MINIRHYNPETEDYCVATLSALKDLQKAEKAFEQAKKQFEERVDIINIKLSKTSKWDNNTIKAYIIED